jgi:hypothetical protein
VGGQAALDEVGATFAVSWGVGDPHDAEDALDADDSLAGGHGVARQLDQRADRGGLWWCWVVIGHGRCLSVPGRRVKCS